MKVFSRSQKREKEHYRKNHTKIPVGVNLRLTDVGQKAEFTCSSPENYVQRFEQFVKNNIKFTFSHELDIVKKMIES